MSVHDATIHGELVGLGRSRPIAARLASFPGLVVPGPVWFDGTIRLPLHPLYLENAYGDPALLLDLGRDAWAAAEQVGAEVLVGAEAAGIPLATAASLVSGLPSAFVRKAGYRGHVDHEPTTRGAPLKGKRTLFVDDAIWRGESLLGFAAGIAAAGGEIVGAYCLVDLRSLASDRWADGGPLGTAPLFAPADYNDILGEAVRARVLAPATHAAVLRCIEERWPPDDPRWDTLEVA